MLHNKSEISDEMLKLFFATLIKSLIRLRLVNCSQGRSALGALKCSKINSVELLTWSPLCALVKVIRICLIDIASAPANSLFSNSSIWSQLLVVSFNWPSAICAMVIIGRIAGLSAKESALASISTGIEFIANARCKAAIWAPGDLTMTAICDQGSPLIKWADLNWWAIKFASSLALLSSTLCWAGSFRNLVCRVIFSFIPNCSKSGSKFSGSAPLNLPTALCGSAKITNSWLLNSFNNFRCARSDSWNSSTYMTWNILRYLSSNFWLLSSFSAAKIINSLGSTRLNEWVVVPSRSAIALLYFSQNWQIAGQYLCSYFLANVINSCGELPRSVARLINSRSSLAKPLVVRAALKSAGHKVCDGLAASSANNCLICASCSAPESRTYFFSFVSSKLIGSFKIIKAKEWKVLAIGSATVCWAGFADAIWSRNLLADSLP